MREIGLLALAAGLATVLALPFPATAADASSDEAAIFDRLSVREQILDGQHTAAKHVAQQRGLLAYRLCRRRELGYAANPESRLDDARAFALALVALRRSAGEATMLATELDHVRGDRTALEAAFVRRATSGSPATNESSTSVLTLPAAALSRPVRGQVVAVPGIRRDGSTKVELRHDGIKMLARLNEPVRAIAAGTVKRVEPVPQGGFAVVTAHAWGLTSIVTGLRDIAVLPGSKVSAGQTLGLAGRNLDGAAVVSIEIWRDGHAQDAGKLLHLRLGRGS
jgi:septal ring factor EnvC (AmiA/AmiB activator)